MSAVVFKQGAVTPRAQGPVTFSQHVAPILFANCTTCHRPGEAAPFQLMSYRDARPLAKAIAAATSARVMPPWKAGASDIEFDNARRLTDEQIETIQRWVADGALEGDASRTPPAAEFTDGWQLGPPDLAVTMSEAYEVPAKRPGRVPQLRRAAQSRSRRLGARDRLQAVGARCRASQSVLPGCDRCGARA